MGKHGGTPFGRDKHVTPAAISPPGVARGRFVGGQQSGLAGCKPPPLFTRGASSCSSQGRRQGEPRGTSPRPSAPTYLPIAEPWQQCFAVSPVDIGESEDLLTEEELDLVQGYMDQAFHDWGSQREGKGQDKAWWEVDSIVSGSYDGNTFVRRVLDHMSSQDEPMGGNPPTYGDLFRGKTSDGPWGHLGRPPELKPCGGTPQVSSVVQVPGKAKAGSDECPKIQALRARLKQKYGETFFSRKSVFPPPVRGPYGEAKIRLKPDPRVYRHREFALRGERKEAMEKILREFIERDWSEPCHSDWASLCFVVPKKVAGEWRLVVNYRGLNTQTQHDSYTLRLIEEILQKQHRRTTFGVIDLKHDFHQMPVADESRACTAMSTPLGSLQWKVMPMGVTNGNAAFQRMLENLLETVRDCANPFVDDVIIASGDASMSYDELLEAHERDVMGVLDLLVRQKLTGSSDKATIAVSEVVFAGHVARYGQRKPILAKQLQLSTGRSPRRSLSNGRTWASATTTRSISRCMLSMRPP